MKKATIKYVILVDGRYHVEYESGVKRTYEKDKAPKTVSNWYKAYGVIYHRLKGFDVGNLVSVDKDRFKPTLRVEKRTRCYVWLYDELLDLHLRKARIKVHASGYEYITRFVGEAFPVAEKQR